MYEIIKYIRTMIEDARGHLIQSLRNTTRKRKYLNFNDEIFVVEDNDEQNSTDISLNISGGGESSILNFPTFDDFPAMGEEDKIYISDDLKNCYIWNGTAYSQINGGGGESSVLNFPTFEDFPATGEDDKIYITEDTKNTYIWTGTDYKLLNDSEILMYANKGLFPSIGFPNKLYIDFTTGYVYNFNLSILDYTKLGDVLNYATLGDFPTTGDISKLYIDNSTGNIYNWNGSIYKSIGESPFEQDGLNSAVLKSSSGSAVGSGNIIGGSYCKTTDNSNNNLIVGFSSSVCNSGSGNIIGGGAFGIPVRNSFVNGLLDFNSALNNSSFIIGDGDALYDTDGTSSSSHFNIFNLYTMVKDEVPYNNNLLRNRENYGIIYHKPIVHEGTSLIAQSDSFAFEINIFGNGIVNQVQYYINKTIKGIAMYNGTSLDIIDGGFIDNIPVVSDKINFSLEDNVDESFRSLCVRAQLISEPNMGIFQIGAFVRVNYF